MAAGVDCVGWFAENGAYGGGGLGHTAQEWAQMETHQARR